MPSIRAATFTPSAHQVAVTLLNHVAEMDADPELDAALGRQAGVALDHAVLHLDGAAHGIHDTPKLNEDPIARPLDDPAVMQSDGWFEEIATESAQPRKRPLLVGAGKLAISGHVGRQNCRQLPGLSHERPLTDQSSTDLTPILREPEPEG